MGALIIFSSTVFGVPTGIVSGVLMLLASAILFFAVWVYNKNAKVAEEQKNSIAIEAQSRFAPPQSSQAPFVASYPSASQAQSVEQREALPIASGASAAPVPQVSWEVPYTPPIDPVQSPPLQPVPLAEPAPVSSSASSAPVQPAASALENTIPCPSCGHPAQPDDNFCLQCGHLLRPLVTVLPSPAESAPIATSMPSLPETPPLADVDKSEEIAASPAEPVVAASIQPEEMKAEAKVEEVRAEAKAEEISASVQAEEVSAETKAEEISASAQSEDMATVPDERPARLVLRSNNGDVIQDYELMKPVLSIGRSAQNDIILPKDKLTSRHHVTLRREGDHYVLIDERSANGTYVDDKKIASSTPHTLHDGAKIRIGIHQLVFYAQYQPVAGLEDMPTIVGEDSTRKDEALTVAANATPDELNISAFYPHTVAVEKWNTLLVYTHLESVINAIYKDAGRHKLAIEQAPPRTNTQSQGQQLPEQKLTLVPEFQGMMFNPKRLTFTWSDAWKRSTFRFVAKKELLGTTIHGKVNLFIGPLLVATLNVTIRCEQQTKGQDNDAQVTARLYKRIYTAYSPEDAVIAQAYHEIYKLPGFEFIEELDKLRSDHTFSDEQKHMLETAEVFQLFWSAHAKDSAALAEEWQYALQRQKGEDFLRPVYWEIPLVPPSKELAALPFTYIPEYAFADPSTKMASISTSSSKSIPVVKKELAPQAISAAQDDHRAQDASHQEDALSSKDVSSSSSEDESALKEEVSVNDEPVLKEEVSVNDELVLKEEASAKEEPVLEEPVLEEEVSAKEEPALKEEVSAKDELAVAEEKATEDEPALEEEKAVENEDASVSSEDSSSS